MVIFDLAEGARPEPNHFNRLVKMVGSGQICGPGCRNRLSKNPLEFLVCAIPQSRGEVPGAPEHATVIGDLLDALKVGNKGLYFISVFYTAQIYTVSQVCQYPSRKFFAFNESSWLFGISGQPLFLEKKLGWVVGERWLGTAPGAGRPDAAYSLRAVTLYFTGPRFADTRLPRAS
ncbi:MAG: hypothetical protein IKN03_06815 [Fibrobacter sp.]|nr:hypothetical protein [Fibrobacter sp.]